MKMEHLWKWKSWHYPKECLPVCLWVLPMKGRHWHRKCYIAIQDQISWDIFSYFVKMFWLFPWMWHHAIMHRLQNCTALCQIFWSFGNHFIGPWAASVMHFIFNEVSYSEVIATNVCKAVLSAKHADLLFFLLTWLLPENTTTVLKDKTANTTTLVLLLLKHTIYYAIWGLACSCEFYCILIDWLIFRIYGHEIV